VRPFWIFVLEESEEDEVELRFSNECRLGNSSPYSSSPWGVLMLSEEAGNGDREVELFDDNRPGSKRLSKDSGQRSVKGVSGDLSSVPLVDR
jgi:hypothetical protein